MSRLEGSDPDELDKLAERVGTVAQNIKTLRETLHPRIANAPWSGPDAEEFRQAWSTQHRRAFDGTVEFLINSQTTLRRNAGEQRKVSATLDGLPGVGPAGSLGQCRVGDESAMKDWARRVGSADAMRLIGASPEAQRAWWEHLTDEQRRAMLMFAPGLLLALGGLSSDVRAEALKSYDAARRKELAERADSISAHVEGGVSWFHFSADASAVMTTFKDGHCEVALKVSGEFGASLKAGGVGVGADGEVVYTFANADEARRFLQGLERTMMGTAGAGVADYLGGFSGHISSATISTHAYAEAEAKAAGQEVGIRGAVGGSYDAVSHTKTLYVEGKVDLAASLGGAKLSGSASVSLSVRVDPQNHLDHLNLKFDVSNQGTIDIKSMLGGLGDVKDINVSTGQSVSISASLDLKNPIVADMAKSYMDMQALGDPRAGAELCKLLRAADVSVQVNEFVSAKQEVDLGIGKGSVGSSSSHATATVVKPPNGGFHVLN